MASLLQTLQKRSEKEKLVIAGAVACVVVGILIAGWSYNLAHLTPRANLANPTEGSDGGDGVSRELEDSFNRFQASMEAMGFGIPREATGATTSTTTRTESASSTATTSLGAQQIELFFTPTTTPAGAGESPADVLY